MSAPTEDHDPLDPWALRWAHLTHSVGLDGPQPLIVALSGGADSVLLLHLLAEARPPRSELRAVHVDHGLRGAEAGRDASFVHELCASLGVPLTVCRLDLDSQAPDLERRAREARYRALLAEARRAGIATVATGHHADDQVETLLLRWMRGSTLAGLRGARPRSVVRGEWPGQPPQERPAGLAPVTLARPLLPLRREELRELARARGLRWVEDSSNADPRFARNRVRRFLLPALERSVGPEAGQALVEFARSVERLESELTRRVAHIAWRPAPFARATRHPAGQLLGGSLERADLMALDRPLARRALWRLLTEATGRAPSRPALEAVLADLWSGRCARHTLTDGWTLLLRAAELIVLPPLGELDPRPAREAQRRQLRLPFEGDDPTAWRAELELDGELALIDGRRIVARPVERAPGSPVPAGPDEVELDLDRLPPVPRLWVRSPRPGDRFHPLGGPGTRPLRRFLSDAGVPREERQRVLLIGAADRILWVAGLRPAEWARVGPQTRRRLRLGVASPGPEIGERPWSRAIQAAGR